MGISHLNREVSHGTRRIFVVLLIEKPDFYITNPKRSIVCYTHSFHQFGEQLLEKLFNLHVVLDEFLQPSLLGFLTMKLSESSAVG